MILGALARILDEGVAHPGEAIRLANVRAGRITAASRKTLVSPLLSIASLIDEFPHVTHRSGSHELPSREKYSNFFETEVLARAELPSARRKRNRRISPCERFTTFRRSSLKLTWRPSHLPAAQKVNMKMGNAFAGMGAVVDYDPVTGSLQPLSSGD